MTTNERMRIAELEGKCRLLLETLKEISVETLGEGTTSQMYKIRQMALGALRTHTEQRLADDQD